MPIHWAYKDPNEPELLEQGDVLQRTDALIELLRMYHPYYADHAENRLFIVLTQSCDLVERDGGMKSRYITIAPVRALPKIIEYEFGDQLREIDGIVYGSGRVEAEVQKFLERLFNNNDPSYFYLEPEPAEGIADPVCAMLRLGISFKAQHRDIFLGAKLIGLKDSFQAKLGWLLGQSYSRVGTKDFDSEVIKERASRLSKALGLWVEGAKYKAFEREIERIKQAAPGQRLSQEKIGEILAGLPQKKDQVINAVLDVAAARGLLPQGPSPDRFKFRRALENDPAFANQFKD